MALIQKTSPVGIDITIDRLQVLLFDVLTWKNVTKGYESFHRVYKNETNDGKEPEAFISGIDYNEVFTKDKFSATSFFLIGDNRPVNDWIETDVDIIFQLNLDELYPNITHRADEEAHADVYNALNNNPYNADITNITKGIANVYSDLNIDQVKFDDMSPCHVFKITLKVNHSMDC